MSVHRHLLIDIGNTRVKWGWLSAHGLLFFGGAVGHKLEDFSARLTAMLGDQDRTSPAQVLISSVAPPQIDAAVIRSLSALWSFEPRILRQVPDNALLKPIYDDPSRFGVDRWLALTALRQEYGYPSMVVDCGTAVKVDVLDTSGQHAGGLLLPGMRTMQESFANKLSHLPAQANDVETSSGYLAKNTRCALNQGTLISIAAMVEKVGQKMQADYNESLHLVLTGGDAQVISEFISCVEWRLDELLVMKGMTQLC